MQMFQIATYSYIYM